MLIHFPSCFQPDEDLFNPDYVEVDRVLDVAVTTDTETGEVGNATSLRSLETGGGALTQAAAVLL